MQNEMHRLKPSVVPVTLCLVGMFVFSTVAILISPKPAIMKHKCSYKYCPFKGEIKLSGQDPNCTPGTDCYSLDSVHFLYPNENYDYLDSLLFTPVK